MLLRVKSHRARERVERAVGAENMTSLYNLWEGHFYEVPDHLADRALEIPSVNRARRPKNGLHPTWRMS